MLLICATPFLSLNHYFGNHEKLPNSWLNVNVKQIHATEFGISISATDESDLTFGFWSLDNESLDWCCNAIWIKICKWNMSHSISLKIKKATVFTSL